MPVPPNTTQTDEDKLDKYRELLDLCKKLKRDASQLEDEGEKLYRDIISYADKQQVKDILEKIVNQ